jgi:hypothetical protein
MVRIMSMSCAAYIGLLASGACEMCFVEAAEWWTPRCRQLDSSNRTHGQGNAAEATVDIDIRDPGAFPATLRSIANRFTCTASTRYNSCT